MGRGPFTYPVPLWLLVPLAVLAGCAALIHLLAAATGLGFEFGASVAMQTTVFGCFMGGAALGMLLVGSRADASTRPLRWCGLLQVGLAIYSVALPTVRGLLGESLGLLPNALAVAAMPGLLTGGTIAVLTRAGSDTTDRASATIGVLLGSLAIGGAVAVPLVASAGPGAALYSSVLHVLAGLVAWGLSIPVGAREVVGGASSRAAATYRRASWTGDGGLPIIVGLAVLGITLPLQRFAWQRVLPGDGEALFLHLLGLGAGCGFGALLVYTGTNARRVLARTLLAATVLMLAPLLFAAVLLHGDTSPASAVLLIVPGAMGVGLALPLIFRAALSDREAVGRQTGTLIAIFASAWAVALLLFVPPMLAAGSPGLLVFLAGILLLAGGTWFAFGRGLREWIPAGAAALLSVVVLLAGGLRVERSWNSAEIGGAFADGHSGARRRGIAKQRGLDATYAVVEDLETGIRRLYRDGVPDAPAGRHVDAYRMAAHLPLLLHERPARVLVGSFGSGVVAGAVAAHSDVETIDVIDDDDAIFELAREFGRSNRDVLGNAVVNTESRPLRRAMRTRRGRYDVIVLEPRNPSEARGAAWFTAEFYALARATLNPRGLFCQRLPIDAWSPAALQSAASAAAESFPFAEFWEFDDGLYLLAGNAKPALKADPFLVRVSKIARDLQRAYVSDPSHLLAGYVCDAADFSKDARALHDGDRGEKIHGSPDEWRQRVASCTARTGPAWARGTYDTLPAAAEHTAKLRVLLASDRTSSADLYALADAMRGDLRARVAAERLRYDELMAKNDWAGAARLALVRDRGEALRQLAASIDDDDRRRFYEILLLRNGGLPSEAALARLAEGLTGSEQLYVRNRLHAVRGEDAEDGTERMPTVALRDPGRTLSSRSEEKLRELLLDAECAGLLAEFDKAAWTWWKGQSEAAEAVILLDAVGWRQSLRAARQVAGKRRPRDLVLLAPIFAAAHPGDGTWERLCEDQRSDVRAAAAEAARAHGNQAHVETLVKLCRDPSREVRTGAFHSLEGILGEAVTRSGYDPADPSPESVKRIEALAAEAKSPAAPGK